MPPEDPFASGNKGILNRLGIVKNQLLVFVVLILLILNGSAAALDRQTATHLQQAGGLVMHLASIPIVLLGIGFYIYAYLRLPSSAQELVFVTEAQTITKEHEKRRNRSPKATGANV
jgi:uncharacterized membrane protein